MQRIGALCLPALFLIASCSDAPPPKEGVELTPIDYTDIAGWSDADITPSLRAFERSCAKLDALAPERPLGMDGLALTAADWQAVCANVSTSSDAQLTFESWFQPYRVTADGEESGLFTGYYEPLLFGARTPSDRFKYPLRTNPRDMVTVDLASFNPELDGRRLVGRVEGGQLVPYPDRAGIDRGAVDDVAESFIWVDDAIAKFFLQIQGSGLVELPDGETIRVGYAGQNGHGYRAIGRDLIEMGELTRENVSLQSIRRWLLDHPANADEIMHKNASYIFFRELTGLGDASGPLGSQNVPLEPRYSLAVDRKYWPMGLPVWLDLEIAFSDGERKWRQLLIAQDTGGAIKGGIRGDVFWGAGAEAEYVAGHMKSSGGMIIFLPRAHAPSS